MPGGHPHSRLTAQCRPARLVPIWAGRHLFAVPENGPAGENLPGGACLIPRDAAAEIAIGGLEVGAVELQRVPDPGASRCLIDVVHRWRTFCRCTEAASVLEVKDAMPKTSPNRILAPAPASRVGKIGRDTFRSSRGPGRAPFAQLRASSPNSIRLCLRQAYPRRAREPAPPGVSPSRSSGAGWAGSTSHDLDADPELRGWSSRCRSGLFAQLGSRRWATGPGVRTVKALTPPTLGTSPTACGPTDRGIRGQRTAPPGVLTQVGRTWFGERTRPRHRPSPRPVGNRRSDDGPCR